jgi:hypothetical protein
MILKEAGCGLVPKLRNLAASSEAFGLSDILEDIGEIIGRLL